MLLRICIVSLCGGDRNKTWWDLQVSPDACVVCDFISTACPFRVLGGQVLPKVLGQPTASNLLFNPLYPERFDNQAC